MGRAVKLGAFLGRGNLKNFQGWGGPGPGLPKPRAAIFPGAGAGHASLTYFANLAIIQHWLDKMAKNNHSQEMASSQTTQSALSNKTLIDNADVLKKISCAYLLCQVDASFLQNISNLTTITHSGIKY